MGGVLALTLVAAGLLYWFLSNDGIRVALEQQATAWLGQPVHIAKVGAQFWPRPGVTLEQVTIGEPARLTLAEVGVSTELSALLRRRIADGAIRIRNTRLELPLPFEIPTDERRQPASRRPSRSSRSTRSASTTCASCAAAASSCSPATRRSTAPA